MGLTRKLEDDPNRIFDMLFYFSHTFLTWLDFKTDSFPAEPEIHAMLLIHSRLSCLLIQVTLGGVYLSLFDGLISLKFDKQVSLAYELIYSSLWT